jgi:hypothetical protein
MSTTLGGYINKWHVINTNTYPGTIKVKGTIKVHGPMLEMIDRNGGLHVSLLSDEIGKHLWLNHLAASGINGVGAKFDRPFNDAAIGFLVVEDIAKWVLSNHC